MVERVAGPGAVGGQPAKREAATPLDGQQALQRARLPSLSHEEAGREIYQVYSAYDSLISGSPDVQAHATTILRAATDGCPPARRLAARLLPRFVQLLPFERGAEALAALLALAELAPGGEHAALDSGAAVDATKGLAAAATALTRTGTSVMEPAAARVAVAAVAASFGGLAGLDPASPPAAPWMALLTALFMGFSRLVLAACLPALRGDAPGAAPAARALLAGLLAPGGAAEAVLAAAPPGEAVWLGAQLESLVGCDAVTPADGELVIRLAELIPGTHAAARRREHLSRSSGHRTFYDDSGQSFSVAHEQRALNAAPTLHAVLGASDDSPAPSSSGRKGLDVPAPVCRPRTTILEQGSRLTLETELPPLPPPEAPLPEAPPPEAPPPEAPPPEAPPPEAPDAGAGFVVGDAELPPLPPMDDAIDVAGVNDAAAPPPLPPLPLDPAGPVPPTAPLDATIPPGPTASQRRRDRRTQRQPGQSRWSDAPPGPAADATCAAGSKRGMERHACDESGDTVQPPGRGAGEDSMDVPCLAGQSLLFVGVPPSIPASAVGAEAARHARVLAVEPQAPGTMLVRFETVRAAARCYEAMAGAAVWCPEPAVVRWRDGSASAPTQQQQRPHVWVPGVRGGADEQAVLAALAAGGVRAPGHVLRVPGVAPGVLLALDAPGEGERAVQILTAVAGGRPVVRPGSERRRGRGTRASPSPPAVDVHGVRTAPAATANKRVLPAPPIAPRQPSPAPSSSEEEAGELKVDPREARTLAAVATPGPPALCTLWIAGLPHGVPEPAVLGPFSGYGRIVGHRLIRSRGGAYIDFESAHAAQAAIIGMDGTWLPGYEGRGPPLQVELKGTSTRRPFWGGGGGRPRGHRSHGGRF